MTNLLCYVLKYLFTISIIKNYCKNLIEDFAIKEDLNLSEDEI